VSDIIINWEPDAETLSLYGLNRFLSHPAKAEQGAKIDAELLWHAEPLSFCLESADGSPAIEASIFALK